MLHLAPNIKSSYALCSNFPSLIRLILYGLEPGTKFNLVRENVTGLGIYDTCSAFSVQAGFYSDVAELGFHASGPGSITGRAGRDTFFFVCYSQIEEKNQ